MCPNCGKFSLMPNNFKWDGTHKGEILNPGVYAYILVAVCPDNGDLVTKTGDITVLR